MILFEKPMDYTAFEHVMEEALGRHPEVSLLAYAVMPTHWHLLLVPSLPGVISQFIGWMTMTHAQRWQVHRHRVGLGHVYQGRFKSFPVQTGKAFATVARYIERNPLRAGLVDRADAWRWSSLWRMEHGTADQQSLLSPWSLAGWPRPGDWLSHVQRPLTKEEYDALRTCAARGRPFGDPEWQGIFSRQHGLDTTLRPRGRPPAVT